MFSLMSPLIAYFREEVLIIHNDKKVARAGFLRRSTKEGMSLFMSTITFSLLSMIARLLVYCIYFSISFL